MKITKFAQSTFLISMGNETLLIDPGNYNYQEGRLKREDHKDIDHLIITHIHGDHFDLEAVRYISKVCQPQIYCPKEVADVLIEDNITANIVKPGDSISNREFSFKFVPIDHVFKGMQVEGFGVVIEFQGIRVYHTSDTMYLPSKPDADILFVPINNRGVCMGIEDAVRFTLDINPKMVIPIHYDSPKDIGKVDPVDFKKQLQASTDKIEVKVLMFGECINL